MENATSFHPLDYVSVLRRRMWWLITPLVLAIAVGAALVAWLPREYTSSATIGVSLPTLSPELLTNTPRVTPEERSRNIQQVLFSPALLQRVVREEGLDKHMPAETAAGIVRSRVVVTVPRPEPNMPPGSMDQFFLAYKDATPDTAQRITNRLSDVFVEESSRRREVRAEETSAFVSKQLGASQERLSGLEARLRSAKEAFMGALPEQANANLTMATSLQQQLDTTVNAMRGEQDRLSMIERQIEAMKQGAAVEVPVPGTTNVATPAALRVVQLERELAVARGTYTDKHPEVMRLREELTAARADMEGEQQRPDSERVASLRVNPAYQGLLSDRERIRLRMRDLERQEAHLRGQITMYRVRVESAPRVDQQIAALQREYDLEKAQYSELTTQLRNAQMSESLVRSRGGEQFTVLTRASWPSAPSSPNTQRLMVVAVLLGLCLGGGLALGREYLDRSIHDARALNDLDLPVLGEIPRIARVG